MSRSVEKFFVGDPSIERIRSVVKLIDDTTFDDPIHALRIANKAADLASELSACARAEIFAARGTVFRHLDQESNAERDLLQAAQICKCRQCRPRTQLRQAGLFILKGESTAALQSANAAYEGFLELVDRAFVGRTLILRATAQWCSGDLDAAIVDARKAKELIVPSDYGPFLSALHTLSFFLISSGDPKNWNESLSIIESADEELRRINGPFRLAKLYLRWVRILAEYQLGIGTKHGRRLHLVFRELVGIGLPVPKHQVAREMERSRKHVQKNPLDVAALACDLGLLGVSPGQFKWAASEAHDLLPANHSTRPKLAELRDAAGKYRKEEIPTLAHAIRTDCPSAPPLPPRLAAA